MRGEGDHEPARPRAPRRYVVIASAAVWAGAALTGWVVVRHWAPPAGAASLFGALVVAPLTLYAAWLSVRLDPTRTRDAEVNADSPPLATRAWVASAPFLAAAAPPALAALAWLHPAAR